MRTKVTFPVDGPAHPEWLNSVVTVANHPLRAAGKADDMDMRPVGCALIRSTVNGRSAVLTFEWSESADRDDPGRQAFVKLLADKAAWKDFTIETLDEEEPQLGP